MSRYAAALDFGSSKVALAVGEKTDAGVRIVSYHDAPAAGIECGEIANDFKVGEIVRTLVDRAQAELQESIGEVTVGLSGRVLHSKDLPCEIKRKDPESHITPEEVRQITRSRYRVALEGGEVVFDAIPQRYSTEDRIGITGDELIGMVGGTIEADFKLFYGRKALLDRRKAILADCGLTPGKAILTPIASARAVLSAPEMENGVALVDIGGSTTEVAIIKENIVRDAAIIPFGGDAVTADIKTVTGITGQWAETLKVLHGRCCEEYAVENKKLILKNENNSDDGEVEISLLARVIEARMSEIFDAVRFVIERSGYATRLTSGVVITGGSCHLDNIIQLAGALLGQKIRLAAPQGSITGDSVEDAFDVYASTAVGLVLETIEPKLSHAIDDRDEAVPQLDEKPVEVSLFEEEEPEELPRLSPREERKRKKEEERKKNAAKKPKKEKGPSIFDYLFSDNDNA